MEDLDHYDLILVLDRGLHAEILAQVAEAVPLDSELYLEKVGSRGNEGEQHMGGEGKMNQDRARDSNQQGERQRKRG